jgi:hypothetical protein
MAALLCVSIRQHTPAYVSIRRHLGDGSVAMLAAYVSIRQHTPAYVSIRQHMPAYVSIRQHTSAYVSIRQHPSAYVSIRQLHHLGDGNVGELGSLDVHAQSQYLYFCTSKASKLSTAFFFSAMYSFESASCLHTSAYVSLRQPTSA